MDDTDFRFFCITGTRVTIDDCNLCAMRDTCEIYANASDQVDD